jgi:uncharacterized cupin superfamily protein
MGVAHWDEIEGRRNAKGEMDATWQALGHAAGTRGVGVNRVRVAPGKLPTPPHSHGASEELYFVLGGSGLAWQDDEVHEVRPLDCVVHRANEMEHTFVAGPDGLEYLVFGTRHPTEIGWLPRSRAIRIGWPWVEGRDDDPWDIEATVPPLEVGRPAPRPANISNVDELEFQTVRNQTFVYFTADDTTRLAGLGWEKLPAGRRGSVPHCHSAEEEIFVVLDGEGTLELWAPPKPGAAPATEPQEMHALRAGHVVSRPAGTRISHCFRTSEAPMTYLAYGTREPSDVCYYPRSNKIYFRGLGLLARLEPLDYFDGEPG